MKNFVKVMLVLVLPTMFFLMNCSRKINEHAESRVTPPFEKANVEFTENTIEADKGGEIKFENGTKITIPENAFVDGNGKPVRSKVKIKYREFHNSAQILMSGIPMKYGNENFQTAGMFEVKGLTEDNATVQLADDKTMNVQMASFASGDNYNFYFFDERQEKWILKGKTPIVENTEKKLKLKSLAEVEAAPIKPVRQKDNSLVFDLDVNPNLYPELRDFSGVVWQYSGSDPMDDPEKTPWVFNEKWSFVELVRTNDEMKYSLHLKDNKHDYKTIVSPVLNGKYYKEALGKFEKKMALYESVSQIRKSEVERMAKEADILRTFSVKNFGIYNWDCFYKNQEKVVRINADLKLNEEIAGFNVNGVTLYLITGNQRAVIVYDKYSRQNFTFNPDDDNKLLAILPGDRIAIFRNDDFKTLVNSGNLANNLNYTFVLKVIDKQILTAENLNGVLNSI